MKKGTIFSGNDRPRKEICRRICILYFNSDEKQSWKNAVKAAHHAGYELPAHSGAEAIAKAIHEKEEVKTYIESQIALFKEKLSPQQRRNLWTTVTAMTTGEPDEWTQYGSIDFRF